MFFEFAPSICSLADNYFVFLFFLTIGQDFKGAFFKFTLNHTSTVPHHKHVSLNLGRGRGQIFR